MGSSQICKLAWIFIKGIWFFTDDRKTELTATEAFFCGGIARTVAAAMTVPFTIAKTRSEYIDPAKTRIRMVRSCA